MNPLRDEPVEGEAVERELDERRLADAVGEAGARHLRAALHVDAAESEVVERLEAEFARLAARVGSRPRPPPRTRPARSDRAGWGHGRGDRCSAPRSASSSAWSRSSSAFTALSSSSCSGVGLPLSFCRALQLLDLRKQRAPRPVGLEECVELLRRALAGQGGAPGLGVVARCLDVDHDRASRYASITCATPSSDAERADEVCHREDALVRVRDGHAVRRPLEQLDVVLPVTERDRFALGRSRGAPRGRRAPRPSSPPGSRTRGSTGATSRCRGARRSAPSCSASRRVERVGITDRDELRGRFLQPVEQAAHRVYREASETTRTARPPASPRRRRARRRRSS